MDFVQIIGERHSGTKLVKWLIQENFKVKVNDLQKHWFLNEEKKVAFLYDWELDKYDVDPVFQNINNSKIKIIIVVRNMFDWILSMHKEPYHSPAYFKDLSLNDFIRTKWVNQRDEDNKPGDISNIIDLRTKKYKNYLEFHRFKELTKSLIIIRYEDILSNPKNELKKIANGIGLKRKGVVQRNLRRLLVKDVIVNGDKLRNSCHSNLATVQKRFSNDDLYYIQSQMDSDLEKELGYSYKLS